jgi:DNA polymerase-1
MLKLDEALMQRALRSKMILQVHDELVFEVPYDELSEIEPLVRAEMEGAMPLAVPLVVDIKSGRHWAEME